jgi:serine/threonine protein kinase
LVLQKLDFNLSQAVKRVNLTNRTIKNMFIQCLQRLEDLHSIGYVHRDLKLNNFMVKNRTIYLIDFGNCRKSTADEKPDKGKVFGDLKYMSVDSHAFLQQRFKDDV